MQKRQFIEDVTSDVAAAEVQKYKGDLSRISTTDCLTFLDRADPITRHSVDIGQLSDVYVDRTFDRFLDILSPDLEASQHQINSALEALRATNEQLRKFQPRMEGQRAITASQDIKNGNLLAAMAGVMSQQEKISSGMDSFLRQAESSGAAVERFLGEQTLLQNLSNEHTIAMAKKVWIIWGAIGDIHQGNTRMKVPRFASTPYSARLYQKVPTVQYQINKIAPQKLAGDL